MAFFWIHGLTKDRRPSLSQTSIDNSGDYRMSRVAVREMLAIVRDADNRWMTKLDILELAVKNAGYNLPKATAYLEALHLANAVGGHLPQQAASELRRLYDLYCQISEDPKLDASRTKAALAEDALSPALPWAFDMVDPDSDTLELKSSPPECQLAALLAADFGVLPEPQRRAVMEGDTIQPSVRLNYRFAVALHNMPVN
jgi:hypothetical protein